MTRPALCAGGDGLIAWVSVGRWDEGGWQHQDGTRWRDGHVAAPVEECPRCGIPLFVDQQKEDPWAEPVCPACGNDVTTKEESMDETLTPARLLPDGTRIDYKGQIWTSRPEVEIAGSWIRWHSETGLAGDRAMDAMLDDGARVLPDSPQERAAETRRYLESLGGVR